LINHSSYSSRSPSCLS